MSKARKGQFIMGAVSLLSNEFNGFGDSVIKELTYKQWFLLLMISRMEGENNINAIADFVGTSRQNIKKMLVPLEKGGFVAVRKSKSDMRSLIVGLTDKAFEFFKENDMKIAAETEKLFSPLSDEEMDVLTAALKKLMHCIEEYSV